MIPVLAEAEKNSSIVVEDKQIFYFLKIKCRYMKKLLLPFLLISMIIVSCDQSASEKSRKEKFKGFMIDAARDVEKMNYYYRLLDFFSEKGFNVIIFRLTDDEGCAMKFSSHPELITHQGAYSAEEIKKFIAYASTKHIEIIPEIESFGHTKYITRTQRYSYLRDYPDETYWMNAICPLHDTTLKIMKDLYTEVASIFPCRYIHIGCDEVDFGASAWSQEMLKTKSKSEIYALYINTLNRYVKEQGKKTIIWGDMIIHRNDPQILDMLDKDIVMMDWNYWDIDDKKIDSIAREVIARGFELIGAPAANWFAWGPRIGLYQLENLLCFSRVYHHLDDPKNLGLIVTHWAPKRYIQNCQWDTYALIADILNHPGSFDFNQSISGFCQQHYGLPADDETVVFFREIYQQTPSHSLLNPTQVPLVFQGKPMLRLFPWNSMDYVRKHIATRDSLLPNPFRSLAEKAHSLEPSVVRNKTDFSEFVITLEFIAHLIDRDNMMWKLCHTNPSMHEMKKMLAIQAEADSTWVHRLDSLWQTGRTGPIDSGHLWEFPRAARFTAQLAVHPGMIKK